MSQRKKRQEKRQKERENKPSVKIIFSINKPPVTVWQ